MKILFHFIALCLISTVSVAQTTDRGIRLADPTIFADNGTYYLYGTGSPNGFPVYTSTDLVNWQRHTQLALTKGDSYGTKGFWAPQIWKHQDRYYMAYTADEHIAIASSDSPLGPFKQATMRHISMSGRQIDPFVLQDNDGRFYLYHVRLQNGNRIFVSRLKDDLSDVADSSGVECISAKSPWENTANAQWPVTEGPTVTRMGTLYYLFYSANDFRNIDYAVGYATAPSPTGPWTRFTGNPIISRTNTAHHGSGHGDLFTDKQGQLWYVLHTHNTNDQVEKRRTAIVKLQFVNGQFTMVPGSFRYLEVQAK